MKNDYINLRKDELSRHFKFAELIIFEVMCHGNQEKHCGGDGADSAIGTDTDHN